MKVKKAEKRLTRVEALLSGILNGYAADIAEVRQPLEAAAAAVKRARSAIDSNQSSSKQEIAAKFQPVAPRPDRSTAMNRKFSQTKNRISPEGLKRIVEANKRRSAEKRAAQNAPASAVQQKSNAVKKAPSTQRTVNLISNVSTGMGSPAQTYQRTTSVNGNGCASRNSTIAFMSSVDHAVPFLDAQEVAGTNT